MARTDEPTTAPEARPLGVTVLPSFEPAPRLAAVAEPAEPAPPALAAVSAPPAPAEPHTPRHAEPRGARALLRRRPGRAALVAVPDTAVVATPDPAAQLSVAAVPIERAPVEPVPVGPVATVATAATVATVATAASLAPSPDLAALQAELARERQRADSAESANAVLRRRVAQLDDELAQFRPRAIVPFEDNTD